jgi:hypothetical protein
MRVSYDRLQAQFDDVHVMFANTDPLQIQTSFTRSSREPVRLQVPADCSHTHFTMMMEEVEYMTRCQTNHRTDVAIYLHLATSRHRDITTSIHATRSAGSATWRSLIARSRSIPAVPRGAR